MTELEQRQRVITIAKSWMSTPYRHEARVKGSGCDCITLLAGTFEEAGLTPHIKIPHYPFDWHLHHDAERYMQGLLQYTKEIPEGEQGAADIVLWKIGHCYSHGAIIVDWPTVIHAQVGRNVMMEDISTRQDLEFIGERTGKGKPRPRRFFSYWR